MYWGLSNYSWRTMGYHGVYIYIYTYTVYMYIYMIGYLFQWPMWPLALFRVISYWAVLFSVFLPGHFGEYFSHFSLDLPLLFCFRQHLVTFLLFFVCSFVFCFLLLWLSVFSFLCFFSFFCFNVLSRFYAFLFLRFFCFFVFSCSVFDILVYSLFAVFFTFDSVFLFLCFYVFSILCPFVFDFNQN